MSRVINVESTGKERLQLTRGVVLALRELIQQNKPDEKTHDLAAFICLALEAIWETIDPSVVAWEKRGYWIKADRFRLEWLWTSHLGASMRKAVMEDDWGQIAQIAAQVATKFNHIKIPQKHRLGTPWVGAWEQINKPKSKS